MPKLDGFAVMKLLENRISDDTFLPILILTADIRPEIKRRALSAGVKDFVTKPFDRTEVLLRIQNLLETHGPAVHALRPPRGRAVRGPGHRHGPRPVQGPDGGHGGSLTAESVVGEGTTFTVELALAGVPSRS
jgi:DNA-binding response OmpR family regulator